MSEAMALKQRRGGGERQQRSVASGEQGLRWCERDDWNAMDTHTTHHH